MSITAPPSAPFPPAGVVEIRDSASDKVTAFAFDGVRVTPPGLTLTAPRAATREQGFPASALEAWPAGRGPPRFAVTARSADGRVVRIAAPPDWRAWDSAAQWGLSLELPSGERVTYPFASVAAAPESVLRFESVSHDGSFARVYVGGDALPPAPGSLTVTARDGAATHVTYRAASSTSLAGRVVQLVASPGEHFPLDALSASLGGALEFTAHSQPWTLNPQPSTLNPEHCP